jgi:O-antigen ligase/tetratricopeptide (TPR) repeat protein
MGKGKRKAAKQATPAPLPPPSAGAEVLRRAVLGLITALIVARPLVRGEDPGFLDPARDPGGMFLTWLWLLAAFGWAAWRLWSRRGAWLGGAVEIGLLLAVVCVFLSASRAARYQYPAWLISWEWVGILAAFCLVRQTMVPSVDASSPESATEAQSRQREQRGLLAAIVATAVALSAQAVGQQFTASPPPDSVVDKEIVFLDDTAAETGQVGSATFATTDGLAGYLVLVLPVAVGYGLASWRSEGKSRRTWLALACAALIAVAVLLTGSRGAILATLLTAGAIAAWEWRDGLRKHRPVLAAGAAALAGIIVLIALLGWANEAATEFIQPLRRRIEERPAVWAIIRDHPWLGVGPGNFGRYYPVYMAPSAFEKVEVPHGLFVEIWATCGVFALIGVVVALTAFFWQTLSFVLVHVPASPEVQTKSGTGTGTDTGMDSDTEPAPNWDIYLSGMAGLLLAFVLRALYAPRAEIPSEGIWAALRAIVWFAAFGVVERIAWSNRMRVLALTAGVAAALLTLTVSQGISAPAVAQPLWVAAALALNLREPSPESWTSRLWLGLFLPVPLLGTVVLIYFSLVFYPAVQSASQYQSAMKAGHDYLEKEIKIARGEETEERPRGRRSDVVKMLTERVIKPLEEAAKANPDARNHVILARWYGLLARLRPSDELLITNAILHALKARSLDPLGRDGYVVEAQLYTQRGQRIHQAIDRYRAALLLWTSSLCFSPRQPLDCAIEVWYMKRLRPNERTQFQDAARAYQQALSRDPHDARLHAQLAEVLFLLDKKDQAREEDEQALELDQQTDNPQRKLTEQQREQVRKRLEPPSSP